MDYSPWSIYSMEYIGLYSMESTPWSILHGVKWSIVDYSVCVFKKLKMDAIGHRNKIKNKKYVCALS